MGRDKDVFVGSRSESVRAAKEVYNRLPNSSGVGDAEGNGAIVPLIEFVILEANGKEAVLETLHLVVRRQRHDEDQKITNPIQ